MEESDPRLGERSGRACYCSVRCSKGNGAPRRRGEKKSGGDGAVVTPVPIPNTAVKHRSGDDSRPRKGLENSAPPGFFFYGPLRGPFR